MKSKGIHDGLRLGTWSSFLKVMEGRKEDLKEMRRWNELVGGECGVGD